MRFALCFISLLCFNIMTFQTQNDLKYEMLHDMSAPSSRTISKAEIENQKTHY